MSSESRVAVAVITRRRPDSLAVTLRSLQELQVPPSIKVRCIVVDNDAARSALPVMQNMQQQTAMALEYAVEETPGIPHARNKALELAADEDYIAFIDDDDIAEPRWLAALYEAARAYNADVVKGHIVYTFPAHKEHLAALDIFTDIAVPTGIALDSAWSNNVLFSTKIYNETGLRFDSSFRDTGGSDHHFFRRAKQSGAKIIMCREAVVKTSVPVERTTWRWLIRRNMRVGATLTISDKKALGKSAAIRHAWRAALDSFRYALRLLPGVFSGRNHIVHPSMAVCFAIGRIAGIFHLSPREYYTR